MKRSAIKTALISAVTMAAISFTAGAVLAQDKVDHSAHGGHSMSGAPWAMAYDAANAVMHEGMAISYSDNPDLDFARAMLAHHQGAVAMAQIQLQHGTDPEMRALAQAIIDAQAAEIAQMQAFIAKLGG
jgi:uncharacterized protein (DUF305 family)